MKQRVDLWNVNGNTKYAIVRHYKGVAHITLTDDKEYIKEGDEYVYRLKDLTITDGILEIRGYALLTANAYYWSDSEYHLINYTPEEFAEKYKSTVEKVLDLNTTVTESVMKRDWWFGKLKDTGETKTRFQYRNSFTGNEREITKLYSNFEVTDRKGIISWGTQMLMND